MSQSPPQPDGDEVALAAVAVMRHFHGINPAAMTLGQLGVLLGALPKPPPPEDPVMDWFAKNTKTGSVRQLVSTNG